MITGKTIGHGAATTPGGMKVGYRLIIPEKTPANLAIIATSSKQWQATVERFRRLADAGRIPIMVAKRATFVEEALAHSAETLRVGGCCVLVCQADDGRILGVTEYVLAPPIAYLNIQATDPEQLAGSPGVAQLRGIGTALVAAASRDFLSKRVETVYVHPLDDAAAAWWYRRGFKVCEPGTLCLRGRSMVENLKGSCELKPDCPDLADCLVCGTPAQTEAMRLPASRENPTTPSSAPR